MMDALGMIIMGFMAAVVGVSLPGLLNMTAVKISKNNGRKSAYTYVMGALVVIFIQTYIAIFFAKLIDSSPIITDALQEVGFVIFTVLTVYFLFFAKHTEKRKSQRKEQKSPKENKFLYGMMLAALNVFPIPYYVFLSVTLASYSYPIFERPYTSIFALGVVLGSALMFYLYIRFFKKPSREAHFMMRNINYCIGAVTGVIAIITLFKLVK